MRGPTIPLPETGARPRRPLAAPTACCPLPAGLRRPAPSGRRPGRGACAPAGTRIAARPSVAREDAGRAKGPLPGRARPAEGASTVDRGAGWPRIAGAHSVESGCIKQRGTDRGDGLRSPAEPGPARAGPGRRGADRREGRPRPAARKLW